MGHGIVKLYCFKVSIERCRGTLFCARCPGTHQQVSKTHIYVLVNLRRNRLGETAEYFVVPSKVVSDKMIYSRNKNSDWWTINQKDVEDYRDKWSIFALT
jgi:hypothetical protein